MIFESEKKVLILSAHTDDFEVGMGATAARLVDVGFEVTLAVFCNAWQSLPDGLPKDILFKEQKQAAEVIGINSKDILFFDFPVRCFPEKRQDILEELVQLRRSVNPNLVFGPSQQDVHQDHSTISNEMIRAFKDRTILGYVLPWNILCERREMIVEVEKKHLERKVMAIRSYQSQSKRPYMQPEKIATIVSAGGIDIGVDFAERFEAIRVVDKL